MARPIRCRRICGKPAYDSFAPDGACAQGEVVLSLDEYEAIRLIDLEKLTHEQCARQMDISRTTVTELYEAARFKLADSLINGKRLCISGGHYRFCDGSVSCCRKGCAKKSAASAAQLFNRKGNETMNIAVTYENGEIFQHFGHTEQFKLYTVENGEILRAQVVNTNGSGHGALAGFLRNAGVDVLICGGIGGGAQNALRQSGIQLYGGVTGNADAAVRALLDGKLAFNPNVHCGHHDHAHGEEGHSCGSHGCGSHDHAHSCGSHGCHGEG